MHALTSRLLLLALVSLTAGCRSLLPTEDKRTQNSWQSFDEAQVAFDKIVPHQTTVNDLKRLGFTPGATANVRMLTYLEVMRQFLPNNSITKEDLPADVRYCIEAKDCCHAYELSLDVVKSKRFGNVLADTLNFRKKTHITGWNFRGLIIIKDELVTYKLRSGEPKVDRVEDRKRPLGPFQELESLASRAVRF